MKAPSRPLVLVLIGVLLVAGIAAGVYFLKPDLADKVVLSLSGTTQEVSAGTESSTTAEPAPKAETSTTASGSGGNSGGTQGNTGANASNAGSGSGGGSNPGTGSGSGSNGSTSSGGSGASEGTKPSTLAVRILWWNDTKTKRPTGFEIAFDSKSIKPDVSQKSGTGSIGPCPVGKEVVLVVYPDGRGGKRIEVPFTLTKGMESNSDIDGIHVEVSDQRVRVLGNAVDNFDQTFDRF